MYLWRPAVNNQRYAFTPLLDDSEDENDDELFNSQIPVYDMITQRLVESGKTEYRPERSANDEKLAVCIIYQININSPFYFRMTLNGLSPISQHHLLKLYSMMKKKPV